jgi:hypothetical protein
LSKPELYLQKASHHHLKDRERFLAVVLGVRNVTLTYLDNHRFNDLINRIASTVASYFPNNEDVDLNAFDSEITEALLEAELWPVSWSTMMTDDMKRSLVTRIAENRVDVR